ncbi:MAG: GNAT family N-acetyltransferase [Massilia sp.]
MPEAITVRRFLPPDWPTYRQLRLRSLADSPDAFGSALAAEQQRDDAAWAARLSAAAPDQNHPLVADLGGAAAGLLWAKLDATDPSVVNLYQMWVAPEARARGVAAALLGEAIDWARLRNGRLVQLAVTCGDTAAARLYRRAGFQDVGAPTSRPGTPLFEQVMQLPIG